MPVVLLRNVEESLRDRLAEVLLAKFPELAEELCINWFLESTVIPAFAHVNSSVETPADELLAIKAACAEVVEVTDHPKYDSKVPVIIHFGKVFAPAEQIRHNTCGLPVQHIRADPRLLSGEEAPYAELHPAFDEEHVWIERDAIQSVCDVEVWYRTGMKFYPKKT